MLRITCFFIIMGVVSLPLFAGGPACAEDLLVKDCSELLRMAKNYQEDLKTVDTVLGSAIDAGGMDRIKNYQMKKNSIRRQLQSVLRVIEIRGCVSSR